MVNLSLGFVKNLQRTDMGSLLQGKNWGQISTFNIDSVFICDIMNHGEAIEDPVSRGELL